MRNKKATAKRQQQAARRADQRRYKLAQERAQRGTSAPASVTGPGGHETPASGSVTPPATNRIARLLGWVEPPELEAPPCPGCGAVVDLGVVFVMMDMGEQPWEVARVALKIAADKGNHKSGCRVPGDLWEAVRGHPKPVPPRTAGKAKKPAAPRKRAPKKAE